MLSTGLCAQIACIVEATARKPGNVHRYADFDDVGLVDFLLSAAAVAPVLDAAHQRPVGTTIWEAIRASRSVVATNTNLGIILLLAPLAAVERSADLRTGVCDVLDRLTVEDARATYEAIRLAVPGGLGKAPDQDVQGEPTQTLREVMVLAADRDLVARQYANGFREVFEDGAPVLTQALKQGRLLEDAVILCHLHLMSRHPDSLIERKRGAAEAQEAARRARAVLEREWPDHPASQRELEAFDAWLRAEGHGRNPGTTADLVTACLFAGLRDGTITMPFRFCGGGRSSAWPAT